MTRENVDDRRPVASMQIRHISRNEKDLITFPAGVLALFWVTFLVCAAVNVAYSFNSQRHLACRSTC
jgi:hypothetical protein